MKGLVRLIAELGLTSVIEGVETADQLRIISNAMTVDLMQGFYFSRPVDLDLLRPLLEGAHLSDNVFRATG